MASGTPVYRSLAIAKDPRILCKYDLVFKQIAHLVGSKQVHIVSILYYTAWEGHGLREGLTRGGLL